MKGKKHITKYISEISVLKFVILLFVIIAVGAVGFFSTNIEQIEVVEGEHYTEDQIKDMVVNNIFTRNSILLYLKYKYTSQKSIPFVEYIDIELIGRQKVKIVVYDKNIIGCTEYMNNYIYFDKDGVYVESSKERHKEVPYITGLRFKSVVLYQPLEVEDDEIFDVIIGLTQQISKYELDIDEIQFDKNDNVTLYAKDITVLLGKKDTYDEQLANLPGIFDEARSKGLEGTLHLENYSVGMTKFNFDKKK